ncbi:MAG: hypothetical protein A2787_04580 [Omnitrophica WOR_2 bacterium RIFCSPHIGHO2_01_FULL_48_9]|nr:MAG: hypothetical protein A2787_04580 [Omnitrophica WOR_2 bacterium RIFCSPHIGHO2_01_FULL_48_9]
METLNAVFISPLKEMLGQVAGFVPTLVSAMFLLIVGIVVSKILRDLVHRILTEVRLDKITDMVGLSDLFHKGGIKHSLSDMVSSLIYLILIGVFVFMTVETIGLTGMSDMFYRLLSYVPQVFSAVIVLVLGFILAKVVSKIVSATAHVIDLPNVKFLERLSRWVIIFYAVTISLEELGYGSLLAGKTFDILFAGVVFAYALAFGLGGKDAAAKYLDRYHKK